jgi:PPK2 family polyphosphate:nucleotide phosphotransferase
VAKVDSDYMVPAGGKVKLKQYRTNDTGKFASSKEAEDRMAEHHKQLSKLQEVMYASGERGLLLVLQGMDTAGKDGTIRHIFTGVNPQGCNVHAFKVPTPVEARHDFLWRCHAVAPERGMIGIFNRSHYEDVLSPRVHGLMSDKQAHEHMEQINDWERMLVENGVAVLKFFLHISPEEQKKRLQARMDDDSKHWKLSASDFAERKFWDDYQKAYADVFERTSKKHAPWFVIPADEKWYRNVAISGIVVDAMRGMKLKYPKPTVDVASLKL